MTMTMAGARTRGATRRGLPWPAIFAAAKRNHPGTSLRAWRQRLAYFAKVLWYQPELECFLARMALVDRYWPHATTPAALGLVDWPYINKDWDVPTRLDAVAAHYEFMARAGTALADVDERTSLLLADLSDVVAGVRIVVDRAPWFVREGELVINVFEGDLRVASAAFAVGGHPPRMFIGAIQGIHGGVPSDESLAIFRRLTKDFEGLRPRSLLLEALRLVAARLAVAHMYAVADVCRHHRHPYFGRRDERKLGTDYDQIWLEHGATIGDLPGFYDLSLAARRKSMAEIPSKKRAMYRRRYEIMDRLAVVVATAMDGVKEAGRGRP